MNILVLNGSARPKSNTLAATQAVLRGMQGQLADAEVSIENMTKLADALKPCRGCDACRGNGGTCAFDTESGAFAERVSAADVLVIATPVYWWGMSAQLKLGIDKLYCKGGVGFGAPKKVIVVAVGEDEVGARQYDLIEEQVDLICACLGWEAIGKVRGCAKEAGTVAADAGTLAAFEAQGKEFAAALS